MLFATIEGSGRNWMVKAGATGSRWHSGFGSYHHALTFAETIGYIVWEGEVD